ncbi:MAG: type II toxin-antitoxin system VapB family antitoxin [bacterium]
MKTTVEISDPLFAKARALAAELDTTLRALIEEGLREVVARKQRGRRSFRLRDASFKGGRGLQKEHADGRWDRILDASYGM